MQCNGVRQWSVCVGRWRLVARVSRVCLSIALCFECVSSVPGVCFEGVEGVLQAAGSVSSVAHKQLLLDQPSFKDPSVSQ